MCLQIIYLYKEDLALNEYVIKPTNQIYTYLTTPPLGQDTTQGLFLSGV